MTHISSIFEKNDQWSISGVCSSGYDCAMEWMAPVDTFGNLWRLHCFQNKPINARNISEQVAMTILQDGYVDYTEGDSYDKSRWSRWRSWKIPGPEGQGWSGREYGVIDISKLKETTQSKESSMDVSGVAGSLGSTGKSEDMGYVNNLDRLENDKQHAAQNPPGTKDPPEAVATSPIYYNNDYYNNDDVEMIMTNIEAVMSRNLPVWIPIQEMKEKVARKWLDKTDQTDYPKINQQISQPQNVSRGTYAETNISQPQNVSRGTYSEINHAITVLLNDMKAAGTRIDDIKRELASRWREELSGAALGAKIAPGDIHITGCTIYGNVIIDDTGNVAIKPATETGTAENTKSREIDLITDQDLGCAGAGPETLESEIDTDLFDRFEDAILHLESLETLIDATDNDQLRSIIEVVERSGRDLDRVLKKQSVEIQTDKSANISSDNDPNAWSSLALIGLAGLAGGFITKAVSGEIANVRVDCESATETTSDILSDNGAASSSDLGE